MNERIKELVKQATITHYHGIGEIDELNTEKFAELIIKECCELTLEYKNDDYYNGWLDYRDEIKQHFGVT